MVLVVNCSQKLISLIFGTTIKIRGTGAGCCELLSKVDIFDIRNNTYVCFAPAPTVVNCSQKLISLIFGTTKKKRCRPLFGCELLSKVDIFDIRNNSYQLIVTPDSVVNCSQKLISLIFGTTDPPDGGDALEVVNCSQKLISLIFGTTQIIVTTFVCALWIALKSWYLWYSEQQWKWRSHDGSSCELLSKVDIFDIRNNSLQHSMTATWVVNCSQKLISLIFGTTNLNLCNQPKTLWIALKSWYLWYSEQLYPFLIKSSACCELLSKVDIFDIRNNSSAAGVRGCVVVNCSQKLISLIFGTTRSYWLSYREQLWIALKSWYLWYSEQPQSISLLLWTRCELLSKVDIFDIRNNKIPKGVDRIAVVNCSQKLISLIFGTTQME